jgi:hypothetical protein
MQNLFRLPLAAALAGCFVGSLAGCREKKPTPSIDGLSAALERSAEQTMPAPTLAGEQIALPVPPSLAEARAAEVIQAASTAGGVAIRSLNAQGQISILATIPENNAESFRSLLRHEQPPMNSPSPSTRLIEILIENPVPSPTP